MVLIDKNQIRAEIERRMIEDYNGPDAEQNQTAQGVCAGLLAFLDTLPEQPVDIPSAGSGAMGTTPPKFKLEVKEQSMEGLEEEMDEMWLEYCEDVDYLVYASIARHFAEWGAEYLKR